MKELPKPMPPAPPRPKFSSNFFKLYIDANFFDMASGMNAPANLEFAQNLIQNYQIEKDIPRNEMHTGEIVGYRTKFLGRFKIKTRYYLSTSLDLDNILTIKVIKSEIGYEDDWDWTKTLVNIKLEKLLSWTPKTV